LYFSPDTIKVIQPRRMQSAGYVTSMSEKNLHTEFWWGDLRERDHLKDQGIDGRIILKLMFKNWDKET
jgi:hypothetical protein